MASLKFYIRPNDEYNRVMLRYTFSRDSRADFFCGVKLSSYDNFDRDNEFSPIKKKEMDFEYKNNHLLHFKRELEDIIQSIRLNKRVPTADLVKQRLKISKINNSIKTDKESRINTFFIIPTIEEYKSYQISRVRIGDNLKLSTLEKNNRMMNKWVDFFEFKKQKDIQFEDLRFRYGLFREFAEWCLRKENDFANSSINKYSSAFRNFLRWGSKRDYHNIEVSRFDSPNLKETTNRSILALTPKQLQKIFEFKEIHYLNSNGEYNKECEKYINSKERYFLIEDKFTQKIYNKSGVCEEISHSKIYTSLEVYKDFFCFLCSTSLAYIDAANLKITDYDFDKDCFELIRIKTSVPTTIPMNEMSRAIWMKYSKDKNGKRKDDKPFDTHYLFPRFQKNEFYSNQSCNDALKKIGEFLQKDLNNMVNISVKSGGGIKKGTEKEVPLYKVLHTHMGRKTFITFALSQKISPIDIRRISGHSDEKMFKYYVNSLRDEVKEEFQTMGAFMGKAEFIGPKGKNKNQSKVDELVEVLLKKRKSGIISESEFKEELKKIII